MGGDSGSRGSSWTFLIGPAFFVLAAMMVVFSDVDPIPLGGTPAFDAGALSTAPRREAPTDPPSVHLGGFDRDCMDCHRILGPGGERSGPLFQHRNIKLNHGLNERCLNCHDRKNRNLLWIVDDRTVPFTESHQLCAKCHGPTYRDWARGTHGRTIGKWDTGGAPVKRLTCVECHDPHQPRFPQFTPLPAPNTLRMGKPKEQHHKTDSPLMKREPEGPKSPFYGPQFRNEGH